MLRQISARLVLVGILSAGSMALAADQVLTPLPVYGEIASQLAHRFPREHLSRRLLDDATSSLIWTNLLTALDYERVYFLQSDIEHFRQLEYLLDDQLLAGDVGFAYGVFEVFKERVRNRYAFVEQLLQKGFDLTVDESYQWKRKDAPWPANEAEWNELWRLRIKNEYVRQTVAREIGADAVSVESVQETDEEESPSAPAPTPEEFILKRYKQMMTVMNDYDAEWVLQEYLSALTHAYDPHSDYLSPSSLDDFNIEMNLSLVGIGALLRAEDGAAKVVELIPGGPAERDKRLMPGDRIIAVAQGDEPPVETLHWPLYKVVRLIRGERGTRVELTIIPASDPSGTVTKRIDLIRDEVKLEEQAASADIRTMPGPVDKPLRFGVIRLPSFYANMRVTAEDAPGFKSSAFDVQQLLLGFNTQQIDGVVLDLRNNGGGSLLEAIRMTGLFIEMGPTVQVTERYRRRVLYDRDPAIAYDGPLVVLVNRLSASASEIVAGALQDYRRAIVIGDSRTHGKGTVQSMVDIDSAGDFGSMKITSAKYYRVSGSSTQLRGVEPDIVIPSAFDFMDLGEDHLPNALAWSSVDRAPFLPVRDLDDEIMELRRKSVARRQSDPRFEAYGKLLKRIEVVNETDSVPLNLEKRKELARTEKELADLQETLAASTASPTAAAGTGTNAVPPDLVLDESLRILADMVQLQPTQTAMQAETPRRKSIRDFIDEWFRERP